MVCANLVEPVPPTEGYESNIPAKRTTGHDFVSVANIPRVVENTVGCASFAQT